MCHGYLGADSGRPAGGGCACLTSCVEIFVGVDADVPDEASSVFGIVEEEDGLVVRCACWVEHSQHQSVRVDWWESHVDVVGHFPEQGVGMLRTIQLMLLLIKYLLRPRKNRGKAKCDRSRTVYIY